MRRARHHRADGFKVVQMRELLRNISIAMAIVLLSANAKATTYTVNVYLPTAQLQSDFIANTTTQYQAVVTTASFANTYKVTISSKNPQPPTQPFNHESYEMGFGDGQDDERWKNLTAIYDLQLKDSWVNQCAGFDLVPSTTSMFNACQMAYHNAIKQIGSSWYTLFTSTGPG